MVGYFHGRNVTKCRSLQWKFAEAQSLRVKNEVTLFFRRRKNVLGVEEEREEEEKEEQRYESLMNQTDSAGPEGGTPVSQQIIGWK